MVALVPRFSAHLIIEAAVLPVAADGSYSQPESEAVPSLSMVMSGRVEQPGPGPARRRPRIGRSARLQAEGAAGFDEAADAAHDAATGGNGASA
ncbi:hypothetical protein [Azospirillum sp. TSO35-2]|uniref:hypothetical protein n=1 Tax=Azospirillum sp. TSO35-2 TaxID=716796 RepID=UPI000D6053BB|nr:hypothetical protein [Azospirillum sp. TSO35-2]PWC32676.1 hypothetical protein TSO352_18760 [Azospirillum sp. TSO35-2]